LLYNYALVVMCCGLLLLNCSPTSQRSTLSHRQVAECGCSTLN